LYVSGVTTLNSNLYAQDASFNDISANSLYVSGVTTLNGNLYAQDASFNDISVNQITFPGGTVQTSSYTGLTSAGSYTSANLTIDSNGKITAISNGSGGGGGGGSNYFPSGIDVCGNGIQIFSGATKAIVIGNTMIIDISGNIDTSGNISANGFNVTSDYRIKEDVKNIELNDSFSVNNLRPITYTNKHTNKKDIGFIAHEVQEVFPYLVSGEKDEDKYQSLNYIGLIGVLVKEMKDLKKRVNELETRISLPTE
jgi:hypothetical protein